MKRTNIPRTALLTLTLALLLAIGLNQAARAADPLLYAPGHTVIEYETPMPEPYRGPFGSGPRVYGLRKFHPPGYNVYAPPPAYRPGGFYPGPFWPNFGYFGPGYYWGQYPSYYGGY